ncbi:hypothetical protein Vretimale_5399 [Volvox reticuliferus]|uniref:Uncharacterized protein n=1 Tax=Volvox reticuliferus TaxID=1737510 RepID=A0A8J4C1N5_9CHLO|nr:hypothetical protein Vretifemale_3845 [Volvox reticuliferus]GIM00255.1 hypothetical protein Vretimale_5399 [Volvox reticuliferus]
MASPVKLNSVPNRGGRPSGRRSHELELARNLYDELGEASPLAEYVSADTSKPPKRTRAVTFIDDAPLDNTQSSPPPHKRCKLAARMARRAKHAGSAEDPKRHSADSPSTLPLDAIAQSTAGPAKTPRTRAIADIAQQVRSLCGTMSAVAHQVQDLQARFPAPPPQPPAPAPVVQPVMTLAPPAQVLAPAVPPPAPAPDAAHAGQAALGTAPAQVSGMDGTMSLVLNRVQQPNPLSQNVTSAPAIAKSYRQPPAFNGTTSAQVTEPDAWFDTVIQYLRDTNANPIEGLRYYCTGEVLTWYNSFNRKCKDTNQQLTLEALRTDFIELFGDINRDTPHQVRERLDKHEHAMKPGESVPAYVQRF